MSPRVLRAGLGLFCLAWAQTAWGAGSHLDSRGGPQRIEPRRATLHVERLDLHGDSPAARAGRALLARHGGSWTFSVDRRTGAAQLIQGSGIRLGQAESAAEIEPLVRAFIEEQRGLLGPPRGRLVLNPRASMTREGGRLISVYYDWFVGDVRVEGATIFARLNSGNITQFGSRWVGPIALDPTPRIDADEAAGHLLAYAGHAEPLWTSSGAELLIQPEDDADGALDYRLIWKLRYRTADGPETWEGRVDAMTGEVVALYDANLYGRAVGGVYPRSVYHGNETRVPMPLVEVETDQGVFFTDRGGRYPYAGGSSATEFGGRYVWIWCQDCVRPAQPWVESALGSGLLDYGVGGRDEVGNGRSTPAGRNTFYHLNRVRGVALKWLPELEFLGTPYLQANVNRPYICNAYFDGTTVNFFRSGGGCNNTGEVADIIYHEWGHAIDWATQSADRLAGEGTADVVALQLTHTPLFAEGIYTDGGAFRDLDAQTSPLGLMTWSRVDDGTCSSENGNISYHCVGQIYGQTAWELAQALVGKYGHHTGWRQSERLLFGSLPDAVSLQPDSPLSIYSAYLLADDDDGNLANGTPNAAEIHAAFARHEIAGDPLPATQPCARPPQPELQVTAQCDRVELSWTPVEGATRYEVLRSELLEDTAYLPVGQVSAGGVGFDDTEVAPALDYWYTVMAVDAAGCESTVEHPRAARLPERPELTLAAAGVTDTERGNGSGFVDPGESVDLWLSLANAGDVSVTAVSGTLVALTPGVEVSRGFAVWPDLDPGASAEQEGPLSFVADPGALACGDLLSFRLDAEGAAACAADPSYFELRLGAPDGAGGFVCAEAPRCDAPPLFPASGTAVSGDACGEVELAWSAAEEVCGDPVAYSIHRSTDPGFAPGPQTLIGSSSTPDFVDLTPDPGAAYTYAVRAVSATGVESSTEFRATVRSGAIERMLLRRTFEQGTAGWTVAPPDDAVRGNWELGDPEETPYQPEDDVTGVGANCWFTGLSAQRADGQDNDVDGGTTSLLSPRYDLSATIDPVLRYARWFSNDRGDNPGDPRDTFRVHASNDDGQSWTLLDEVGAGTPLAWVEVENSIGARVSPSALMRFRFSAADIGDAPGDDSTVEAGIDEFRLYDRAGGCAVCAGPAQPVARIRVQRNGDDIVLDWETDPAAGARFLVYKLSGPAFETALRVGSTTERSFVHVGAAAAAESLAYRVTAVDACGQESALK